MVPLPHRMAPLPHTLVAQLATAALAVGDKDLESKFEAAALLLRRGVMFSNSLYT